MNNQMHELHTLVEWARNRTNERVREAIAAERLTREAYVRFLVNQYHLTNGVQKPLLRIASSERLVRRRQLREFLFRFALEEEPHYLLAARDLEALGSGPASRPLEASLWWAYFDSVLDTQPFQRLGGTCILENIGVGLGAAIKPLFAKLDFIRPDTTRFLMVHLHEELPHGDLVLRMIGSSKLECADMEELITGARVATTLYLRMLEWYFDGDQIPAALAQTAGAEMTSGRNSVTAV